jgi:hypothetical protein
MKRRIRGLSQASLPTSEVLDGLYLVRVERMQYRWDKQKPYCKVQFVVLEPRRLQGTFLVVHLGCTAKTLWKLSWFLRDFGYDTELLARDELDEKRMIGLQGVIKASHTTNGSTHLNLDAFAPAGQWGEFTVVPPQRESDGAGPEVA